MDAHTRYLEMYVDTMRRHLRDTLDDATFEAFEAAVEANREARKRNEREMRRLQHSINRRAMMYGDAWEQAMRKAGEAE